MRIGRQAGQSDVVVSVASMSNVVRAESEDAENIGPDPR